MASILKLCVIMFLACSLSKVSGRPLEPKQTLVAHLKLEESSCWGSLYQLQSCTGEVIQFFYDGQTTGLGQDCCEAIYVIAHNCWAANAMLASLGFTSDETALLQGYCDAAVDQVSAPPPSIPN